MAFKMPVMWEKNDIVFLAGFSFPLFPLGLCQEEKEKVADGGVGGGGPSLGCRNTEPGVGPGSIGGVDTAS